MVADEEHNVLEEGTPRRSALKQILGGMLAASAVCEGKAHAAEDPEVTAKVFIELKIVGRSKALDNAKWEKIITRDRRAATGGGKDLTARMVVGVYGKVSALRDSGNHDFGQLYSS